MQSKKSNNMEEFTPSDEFLYSIWNFYEASLSASTRKNYYNVVKGYIKIVGKEPLSLTYEDVSKYYKYLEARMSSGRLSYSTALMRISVMRSLCEYIRHRNNLAGKDYINYFNEIILPEPDKSISDELLPSEQELNNLLEIINASKDAMTFLICSLILKCGLTTSELSGLEAEYIILDNNNNLCIQFPAKRKITRIIRLPKDISQLLYAYMDEMQIFSGPLFYNKHHTKLKVRDAERLLKKYIKQCIEHNLITQEFTMQTMRHAAIKYMLLGGAGEDEVAEYCGITTKWMSRYRRVISENSALKSADMSIISIKTNKTSSL